MSNAQALPAPEAANLDAIIGENIHRLMWAANEKQSALAPLWGMTQSALSLKLRGRRPWFAAEIDAAARHYGVTRDALFEKAPLPETGRGGAGGLATITLLDRSPQWTRTTNLPVNSPAESGADVTDIDTKKSRRRHAPPPATPRPVASITA